MDVWLLTSTSTPTRIEGHAAADLTSLLERDDGFIWVDIPECDPEATQVLSEVFGFHPTALRACTERNQIPTLHAYQDHVFVVLHAPEPGVAGHVHLLELDQFIGRRFLVTVHGPINPVVPLDAALADTRGVLRRLEAGRLRPNTPAELSFAIVSALARRQRSVIATVAGKVSALEGRVMGEDLRSPEPLLEQMFLVRHELITVLTMAAQSHEVYARMALLNRFDRPEDKLLAEDLADQFARVRRMGDGEREFLLGVIEFYQTRTTTKMTMAMERLAVLAAVALPITALATVYGMNVIVNSRTHVVQLSIVLAVMAAMSGALLRWTKKQGWW